MSEAVPDSIDAENNGSTRILLIDDSKVMRKSAVKMLGRDFDVVVAEDGEQGLKMIQEDTTIQVVFTDLNMPKMNGYQFLEAVRTHEDEGIRNLPVIVVTGAENDDEAKERAFDTGATDFITKPFNSTDLKARAHAHADYQRTTKTLQATTTVDSLTGLPNKRAFIEHLEKDLSFVSRHGHSIAVMLVEVDAFNDVFLKIGRKGSDGLLQQIAKILLKSVRKEDALGRIGLSRFAVSLPTAELEGADKLAQRLCTSVASLKAKLRGESIEFSVSIGLYIPESRQVSEAEAILEKTDECLQQALNLGGGQVYHLMDQVDADQPVDQPTPTLSIDHLLTLLQQDGSDAVSDQIPAALAQLEPLWQVLTPEQRQQLSHRLSSA